MIIVVTMAGIGSRFRNAGWNIPKYQIEAHGHSLFEWSMLSLRSFWREGANAVFVVQRADQSVDFIHDKAVRVGIKDVQILEIDGLTDGQATSALKGLEHVKNTSLPLGIYNIDTFIHPDAIRAENIRGDGWIPCFPGQGNGWSFARADQNLRVDLLKEKERISDWATLGFYYFSSVALYRNAYDKLFGNGSGLEKGERYIAPMYNELIQQGKNVYVEPIAGDAVIPLGTPKELQQFLETNPPQL